MTFTMSIMNVKVGVVISSQPKLKNRTAQSEQHISHELSQSSEHSHELTVLCHQILLWIVRKPARYKSVAAVRMLTGQRQVEDSGDVESTQKSSQYDQNQHQRSSAIAQNDVAVLLELLCDLVVAHEARGRPHHPEDSIRDPVGVQSKHGRVCLGERGGLAAALAFRAAA